MNTLLPNKGTANTHWVRKNRPTLAPKLDMPADLDPATIRTSTGTFLINGLHHGYETYGPAALITFVVEQPRKPGQRKNRVLIYRVPGYVMNAKLEEVRQRFDEKKTKGAVPWSDFRSYFVKAVEV